MGKQPIKYKSFITMSKYVTSFSKMDFIHRLIFYVEAPIRYKKFSKVYQEEMKGKTIKKEVNNNDK
jgi:hypothetical protein